MGVSTISGTGAAIRTAIAVADATVSDGSRIPWEPAAGSMC
jgi:hypothetical protein